MKGFKLIEGVNSMFVGAPSQKGKDDEYRDTIWAERELKDTLTELGNKVYASDDGVKCQDNYVEPVEVKKEVIPF